MLPSSPAAHVSESACYRALRCTEILESILQEFFRWDSKLRYQTSLDVALTCRGFFDPACAILWMELPDLFPLFGLLVPIPNDRILTSLDGGRDLPNDQASALLSAPLPVPHSEAWKTFMRYAAYVRKVQLLSMKTDFQTKFLVHLIERNPDPGCSFFPLLREFSLKAFLGLEPAHMRILSSLASPTMRVLELFTIHAGDEDSRAVIENDLVATITNAFPAMHSLVLRFQRQELQHPSRIVADLGALTRLRHFTFDWSWATLFGSSGLHTLVSALPALQFLDGHFSQPLSAPPPTETRILAPSLRHFVCRGRWMTVVELPTVLQCPALDELHIVLQRNHGPTSHANCDTLFSCLRAIADPHFAPHLRRLHIVAPVGRQILNNRGLLPQRRALADILSPLSALAHLEDFRFAMAFVHCVPLLTPHVSDDDMRAIAASLPRVRHLALELDNPACPLPRPTLRSLVHFAALCPRLISLTVSRLDTDPAVPWGLAGEEFVRCNTLRTLRFNDPGAPKEPKKLAAFLHGLFPNLDISECTFAEDAERNVVLQAEMRALQCHAGQQVEVVYELS